MATTSLPRDWVTVLERIDRTLAKAIAAADAREAAVAEPLARRETLLAPDVPVKYWPGMDKKVEAMAQPLVALDHVLQPEEADARKHLADIADLRQRLADWAGRAIG